MSYEKITGEAKTKMEKALEVLQNEFKAVRTGRASPGLVENIKAEYYGTPTPVKQLATITTPDARMIMIKPFDQSALSEIEKAISKSDIGINPQNDGKIIRLAVPPLSEERRKQMCGMVKDAGEKAKTSIRNIRRDENKRADDEEKAKQVTEDEKFRIKEDIQKMTDGYAQKVDEAVDRKSKEVMSV